MKLSFNESIDENVDDKEPVKKGSLGYYISGAIGAGIVIFLTNLIFPGFIPFDAVKWDTGADLQTIVSDAWPLFIYAVCISAFLATFRKIERSRGAEDVIDNFRTRLNFNNEPGALMTLVTGFLVAIWASVLEELYFRWLLFFSMFGLIAFWDFFFGGFLFDVGLVWLIKWWLWMPLANLTTFGLMEGMIYHSSGWYFGSAVLGANAMFREDHAYQGLFGLINSWFIGMFLFWVCFTHGLWAAMVVHFAYNMLIYSVEALIKLLNGKLI